MSVFLIDSIFSEVNVNRRTMHVNCHWKISTKKNNGRTSSTFNCARRQYFRVRVTHTIVLRGGNWSSIVHRYYLCSFQRPHLKIMGELKSALEQVLTGREALTVPFIDLVRGHIVLL